ncbi:MAG: hypothetical protein A2539_02475 [Elusimicrobia bacterium RIFOXYD2_FULL_34_15]|nr:MAG: hypothetical protein A2539_02475 [Elusimicrobia bacterium RIFOXYD2_FULL_34_15]
MKKLVIIITILMTVCVYSAEIPTIVLPQKEFVVFGVENIKPSGADDFNITENNYTTTPNITFQGKILPTTFTSNIQWTLNLECEL